MAKEISVRRLFAFLLMIVVCALAEVVTMTGYHTPFGVAAFLIIFGVILGLVVEVILCGEEN